MKKLRLEGRSGYMILLEIVSIIIGILFALWVDELRVDYKNKKMVEEALTRITREIEINRGLLTEAIQAHRETEAVVDSVLANFEKNKVILEDYPMAVASPDLMVTVFESVKSARIVSMIDFDILTDLTRVYMIQADLKFQFEAYFISSTADPGKNFALTRDLILYFKRILLSTLETEESLLEAYDNALKTLEG